MKRVAVLGTGSIGCILGAYLSHGGIPLTMLSAFRKETAEKITANGIVLEGIHGRIETKVKATYLRELLPEDEFDVVILAVKSNDLVEAVTRLKDHLADDGCVVTLQNGINEEFLIPILGAKRVVSGVSYTGGKTLAPGHVQDHDGRFVIGELDGRMSTRLEEIAQILRLARPVEVVSNIRDYQWDKLGKVCITVPTATVSGSFQFETFRQPLCQRLFAYLALECMKVAGADGCYMERLEGLTSEQWQRVKQGENLLVYRQGGMPLDKMPKDVVDAYTKDIAAGNPLELSHTNGAIVRIGRRYRIHTPANELLIETIEKIREGRMKAGNDTICGLLQRLASAEQESESFV